MKRSTWRPRGHARLILLFLVLLAAVARGQDRSKSIIIHELADAETLNLITSTDNTSQEIFGLMYETLTYTDPRTLEPIPWIAETLPTVSADGLTYEYRIRKDARFSDGHPVTGEDFIFYLKCIKNALVENAAPLRAYYTRVDRVELVDGDPYHIRAVMKEPYYLGDQFIGGLYAFPKHIWDPTGLSDALSFEELNGDEANYNGLAREMAEILQDGESDFDRAYLVGSGPYRFEEFRRNEGTSLVRDPSYWNRNHKYGAAYPERIIYRTINDPDAAVMALKSGRIDFIPFIEKMTFKKVRPTFKKLKLKEAIYDFPAYNYIGYNEARPIFSDKLVRQALARAVDREAIIKDIYFGMARPVQSPIFNKRPEYDSTLPIIRYDLTEAKKLLARAGWSDSDGDGILDKVIDGERTDFRFEIIVNAGNRRREQIALIFIDALKKLGIDARLARLEWAVFLQRVRDGNYDASIGGWAMSVRESDLYQIWHSASAGDGGSNSIGYSNPEADRLIEQIRSERDFSKRIGLYRRFQQVINEDQPYTFLFSEKFTGAYSGRLEDISFFSARPGYNPAWMRKRPD